MSRRFYVRDVLRLIVRIPDGSLFGMFKAYIDESGIGKIDRACALAGFMGDGDECDRVENDWREVVKPLGEFHAVEFFQRKPDGKMIRIYEHLSVSGAESCAFRLINLLRSSKLEPIGMVLDTQTFRTLSPDERRWLTSAKPYGKDWPSQGAPSKPYFAVFHYCVTQANGYCPTTEKIHLTFEEQQVYAEKAKQLYKQLRTLGGKWGDRLADTLIFSTKRQAVMLQAADLLAYAITQKLKKQEIADRVLVNALNSLAFEKEYVRVMDVRSLDVHLRTCPFRTTFWEGLSDPDLMEQAAGQGMKVLTFKSDAGAHWAPYLKKEKIREIYKLDPEPQRSGLNLTDARDDSTK